MVEPKTASRKAERGERRINEVEAAIVRRIFDAYAGGSSPRAIAKQLNAASIPGPGGRPWGDTTIRGQVERGTGILNNALYVGRLEWNRCSYVKNPRTGKRVARPNPRQLWEVVEVPELRIVSEKLWEQVKTRQKALAIEIGRTEDGQALNRAHRRRFLLSGLLKCGVCGGGYTIVAKDRYGCATRRTQGICDNDRTIVRQEIEARVLIGLKERLLAPELVKSFLAEYREETNRLRRETDAAYKVSEREFSQVKSKIARIVHAIEDGMYTPSMKEAMIALESRKAELETLLAEKPDAPALRLHPKLAELYAGKVAQLEAALDDPVDGKQAAEIIRGMIDRIVLVPTEHGLHARLYGDLAAILEICDEAQGGKKKLPGTEDPGSQLSVVAGTRYQRYLQISEGWLPRVS